MLEFIESGHDAVIAASSELSERTRYHSTVIFSIEQSAESLITRDLDHGKPPTQEAL